MNRRSGTTSAYLGDFQSPDLIINHCWHLFPLEINLKDLNKPGKELGDAMNNFIRV